VHTLTFHTYARSKSTPAVKRTMVLDALMQTRINDRSLIHLLAWGELSTDSHLNESKGKEWVTIMWIEKTLKAVNVLKDAFNTLPPLIRTACRSTFEPVAPVSSFNRKLETHLSNLLSVSSHTTHVPIHAYEKRLLYSCKFVHRISPVFIRIVLSCMWTNNPVTVMDNAVTTGLDCKYCQQWTKNISVEAQSMYIRLWTYLTFHALTSFTNSCKVHIRKKASHLKSISYMDEN
jgi:hypothetical protein